MTRGTYYYYIPLIQNSKLKMIPRIPRTMTYCPLTLIAKKVWCHSDLRFFAWNQFSLETALPSFLDTKCRDCLLWAVCLLTLNSRVWSLALPIHKTMCFNSRKHSEAPHQLTLINVWHPHEPTGFSFFFYLTLLNVLFYSMTDYFHQRILRLLWTFHCHDFKDPFLFSDCSSL